MVLFIRKNLVCRIFLKDNPDYLQKITVVPYRSLCNTPALEEISRTFAKQTLLLAIGQPRRKAVLFTIYLHIRKIQIICNRITSDRPLAIDQHRSVIPIIFQKNIAALSPLQRPGPRSDPDHLEKKKKIFKVGADEPNNFQKSKCCNLQPSSLQQDGQRGRSRSFAKNCQTVGKVSNVISLFF